MGKTITFGKYKGHDIESADSDYLVWILGNFDKSHWLEAARDELVRRGHGSDVSGDSPQTMLVKLPGSPQKRVKIGSGNGMVIKTWNPDDPPAPRDTPFYGPLDPAEDPVNMMRRFGRLNVSPVLPNRAVEDGLVEFPLDLKVLHKDTVHAMTALTNEAALYGTLEEAKWDANRMKCQVTLSYLGRHWLFQMLGHQRPQVLTITKI